MQGSATHTFSKLHQIGSPHFWDSDICYDTVVFSFRENLSRLRQEKRLREPYIISLD